MVSLFKPTHLQLSVENLQDDHMSKIASKVATSTDNESSKCSFPQFKRQFAVDVPVPATTATTITTTTAIATTGASKRPTPAIIFSADNSFDSSRTQTGSTLQKNRQDQWSSRQQSSLTSSAQSNGNIRLKEVPKSRKDSLIEKRNKARRKFSILPHVSFPFHFFFQYNYYTCALMYMYK